MKPHRGVIKNWFPMPIPMDRAGGNHLGFVVVGHSHGHERLHGHDMHTSAVIELRPEINEIETLNSRYSVEEPSLAAGMKMIDDVRKLGVDTPSGV